MILTIPGGPTALRAPETPQRWHFMRKASNLTGGRTRSAWFLNRCVSYELTTAPIDMVIIDNCFCSIRPSKFDLPHPENIDTQAFHFLYALCCLTGLANLWLFKVPILFSFGTFLVDQDILSTLFPFKGAVLPLLR